MPTFQAVFKVDLGRNDTLCSATTFKKAFVGRYVHLGMEYYKVFPFYRSAGKFRGRKFHAIKFRDFVRKQAFGSFNFAICAYEDNKLHMNLHFSQIV